jgi:hypothetical protein
MSLLKHLVQQSVLLVLLLGSIAHAGQTIVLTTNENRLDPGSHNQGWWNDRNPNYTNNESWLIGTLDNGTYRNFATFLLPNVDQPLVSAVLSYNRRSNLGTNEATETIGFFHVSTSAAVVNNNAGTNASIFSDLGSGVSYGEFTIPGDGPREELLYFPLNSAARTAIKTAAGNYFSIGGRLLTDDGNDTLLGGPGPPDGIPATLTLTFVPEPNAIAIALIAAVALLRQRTAERPRRD